MAWVDDRIWCHPKFSDVSDKAFRAYVNGLAYATGFGTRGWLTEGQQRAIGATKKVRNDLVSAGLWDLDASQPTLVQIHDWDEHNGRRDARREADRERKRVARSRGQSKGTSAGQSAGRSTGRTATSAHVDGSEGSDGMTEDHQGSTVTENPQPQEARPAARENGHTLAPLDFLAQLEHAEAE